MFYLEHLAFATALIGSSIASVYDLKTTEVPNNVFYAILLVGVPVVLLNVVLSGSFDLFFLSGVTGIGLLGIGYIMYRIGQWGGADMVLLALIGFLAPSFVSMFPANTSFPFGISFLINLFIVGAVYMIGYAIVYAIVNRDIITKFKMGIRSSYKMIAAITVSMVILFSVLMIYLNYLTGGFIDLLDIVKGVFAPVVLTTLFFLIYRFAQAVENFGFKKKIPVSRLKVGDMLLDERKLVGITEDQVKKVRMSGKKTVWIKEGVRFAPAFPLTLLFTLYLGDAINLLISLI